MPERPDLQESPEDDLDSYDRVLGDIVAHYLDRLNEGECLDAEEVLREHPDWGQAVVNELEAFMDLGSRATDDPTMPLGTLGDYILRRQIGRGGMGVVYDAWQNSMDRRVALKVLPPGFAADDRTFNRFMREVKTTGKLNHQNVVAVYSTGIEEGTPWYSMEFVEGETLAQILARLESAGAHEAEKRTLLKGIFETDEVDLGYYVTIAKAFAGVAEGLQHAHSKGIVHRDIKPSNLILDSEGRLRILDFGLARQEGQETLTISGDLVGTPLYMSPEQARVRKLRIDHRTDIYSLGATMYEMLTRSPPFKGKNHQDTLSQIISRDPVPLRKRNPRIPKDLETIILQCLRKQPEDRYGTAEALGQDLLRAARGDPIEARPQSRWVSLTQRVRRQRARIAVAFGVVLLVVTAGLLISKQLHEGYLQRRKTYVEKVRQAVVRFPLLRFGRTRGFGELGRIDPQGYLCESRDFQLLTKSAAGHDTLETAVKELEDATELLPGEPDAHFHLAKGLLAAGKEERALNELRTTLECDRNFAPARILLAEILEGQGNRAAAETERARVVASTSGGWAKKWLAAHQAMNTGQWQTAIEAFGELINGQEEDGGHYLGSAIQLYLGRGIARLESMDFRGAVRDFAVAKELWQDVWEPVLLLGKTYYLMGDKIEAETILHRFFSHRSSSAPCALAIAGLYSDLGDNREALRWVRKIDDPIQNRLAAFLWLQLGRGAEAIQAAQEAIRYDSRDARAHVIMGLVMMAEGEITEGTASIRKAVTLEPKNPFVHHLRGVALLFRRRIEEALQASREAIRLDPRFAGPHNNIAMAFMRLGRIQEAIGQLQRGIELAPRDAWQIYNLAWALTRKGQLENAIAQFERAIALWPEDSRLWHGLGCIHRLRDNLNEAFRAHSRGAACIPDRGQRNLKSMLALERRKGSRHDFSSHWDALVIAHERATALDSSHTSVYHALAAGYVHGNVKRDLDKARHAISRAVAATKRKDPDVLATLAEIQFRDRLVADAIRTLEETLLLARADVILEDRLMEFREALLPDLVSYASIDAMVTRRESDRWERGDFLGQFRTRSTGSNIAKLLPYLEGRLLTLAGRYEEAATRYGRLLEKGRDRTAITLRLAESLRAAGKAAEAGLVLYRQLAADPTSCRDLWNLWLSVCLNDLLKAPAEVAAVLSTWEDQKQGPAQGGSTLTGYAADIHWLLDQLKEEKVIRINAGGSVHTDSEGVLWGPDRFSLGGYANHALFDDAVSPLYQTVRGFPMGSRMEYRVPVPHGRYAVTLHFAEVWFHEPGCRRFDVLVEGKEVLTDYEPFAAGGFAVPDKRTYETEVTDSTLDIGFAPRVSNPKIAAIELRRID